MNSKIMFAIVSGMLYVGIAAATPPTPNYQADGVRLQNIMHIQAALRVAEPELDKLDGTARTRRIAEITRSIVEPSGMEASGAHAPQPLRHSPRAAPAASVTEDLALAANQARYLAEVEDLKKTWPASPTPADFARLEAVKNRYLPE